MKEDVTIIIVEDDIGHATLIKKNLKKCGIKNNIIHFERGTDAVNFISNKNISDRINPERSYIFLLDIRMPDLTGTEVLKFIRTQSDFPSLPVIMLTTADNPEEIKDLYNIGCNTYLTKPVDYEKFTEVIKKLGNLLIFSEFPLAGI